MLLMYFFDKVEQVLFIIIYAITQQTMRLLLWVYDQSYTHKNGHLLSNMVIYHFLWSLKFSDFFVVIYNI